MVSEAQEKTAKWKEQVLSLTSFIPAEDLVLQESLRTLAGLSHEFTVMGKLQSPALRDKHWGAIVEGHSTDITTHMHIL